MADQARRSEVLAAARDAFHEHGFERTATREIASKLGILGGSLYYYIESKEALLFEILTAVQVPGRDAVARALAAPATPAAERLDALLREHVRATLADPAGIALTFSELGSLTTEHAAQVLAGLRDYRRGIEALIAQGCEDGSLRTGPEPKLRALAVLGALNWVHRWYRPDGRLSPQALDEQLRGVVLHGLAAPGAPEGAPPPERAVVSGAERVPERRRQLLDAAAALFAERGYEATTTQDIAERLGLQKATLYHYVRGKPALLDSLMHDVQESSLALLAQIQLSDADPLAKLRAFCARHVAFLLREPARTTVFLRERRRLSSDLRAGERAYADGIARLIEEGQSAGAIREAVDADVAARLLLGSLNWLHEWYRPGGWSPERLATELPDALLAGLVRTPVVA
jgi:AcrR family transcriptional regulator